MGDTKVIPVMPIEEEQALVRDWLSKNEPSVVADFNSPIPHFVQYMKG